MERLSELHSTTMRDLLARRRRRPPLAVLVAMAIVLGLVVPTYVQASTTISFSGNQLILTDGAGNSILGLTNAGFCFDHPSPCLSISDQTFSVSSYPADRCADAGFGTYECDKPTSVVADLGGGADSFHMLSDGSTPAQIHGGSGDDSIYGGPGDDQLYGDDGDDSLFGEAGDDYVDGGAGNDNFENTATDAGATAGRDQYVGGAGSDFVQYGARSDPLTLSFDGVANDGAPGEDDNIGLDVETIYGGQGADVLIGNDAPNGLYGQGGNDTLSGAGGDDQLYGGTGDDAVDGGDGADTLQGDAGNDTLAGGSGLDHFVGDSLGCAPSPNSTCPTGNDQINSRDGIAEYVSCGRGEDVAIVDAIDNVDDDPSFQSHCEQLDRGPTVAPPPAPPGARPGTSNAPDRTAPRLSRLSVAPLHRGKATTVRYTLSEPASVKFTLKRRVRVKGHLRFLAVSGSLHDDGKSGPNGLRFRGRIAGHRLSAGRYKLTAIARDAAGNTSRPAITSLRVQG